jgi:Domain of unknown function (DUF4416)
MGQLQPTAPVLLIVSASSRYTEALDWSRERCEQDHGPVALASDPFDFTETDYYVSTMGSELKKKFLAFERLIDPAALATIKRETNEWEAEYAALNRHVEPRPLNLDPGYVTAAKLVLASTKDHAHRLYLRDGIYAELTLAYRERRWRPMEWTYPDYRRDDYQKFFTRCREYLLSRAHAGP